MKKRGINPEQTVVIAVRVPQIDRDILNRVAAFEGITVSDVVRWALAVWEEQDGERIRRASGPNL
jgi:hypothetical protein